MSFKKVPVLVMGASLMVAAAGCSKKSSSSSSDKISSKAAAQLELTSELVLLPAKDSEAAGFTLARRGSEDASVRKVKLRVNSDAFEAAKQVESILCYFSQTKFWEQAGNKKYQVLVDQDKCEQDKGDENQAQEGGSSSSSQGKNYITAFAEATKGESSISSKIVFRMEKEGHKQEYHANIVVKHKPDDDYPIGLFDMYFTGWMDGVEGGGGHIKVAKASGKAFSIEFMEDSSEGDRTNKTQLMAILTKDGDDFVGKLNSKGESVESQGSYSYQYKVDFDKSYAKVSGTSANTYGGGGGGGGSNSSDPSGCYDRNQFITAIYSYDLADSSNNLVELYTGFPIEATVDGKTARGFAGYHGIGFNDQSLSGKLVNGDTVNKVSFEKKGTAVPYTVLKSPGKLIKYTRNATTLGDLKGVDMSIYDSGTNYIVQWDGSNFVKKASVEFGSNGPVETEVSGTVTIPQWGLFIWVQSLNAGVKIPYGSLSDSTSIGYHSEEIVTGSGNAPSESLVCFSDCPKVTFTSASQLQRSQGGGGMSAQSMFELGDNNPWSSGTTNTRTDFGATDSPIATYTFSTSTMNISNGSTAFALPDVSSVSQNEANNYGFRSGALIPSSTHSALSSTIKAKFPQAAEMDLETFYRWESGASPWNQFTALVDSAGKIAAFDKPMELSYTHSTANDFDGLSTYNGKSFRLNYGGPGQLWGIPFKYNKEYGRGAPMFAIKAGSTATSSGATYSIHPVRGEQYMMKLDADTSCAALSTDDVPTLPTAVDAKADGIDNNAITDATEIRYVGGEEPVAEE